MSEFPRHLRLSVPCLNLVQMEDGLSFIFNEFSILFKNIISLIG